MKKWRETHTDVTGDFQNKIILTTDDPHLRLLGFNTDQNNRRKHNFGRNILIKHLQETKRIFFFSSQTYKLPAFCSVLSLTPAKHNLKRRRSFQKQQKANRMLLSYIIFRKHVCSLNKIIVAFKAAGIKRSTAIHIITQIKSVCNQSIKVI